MIKKAKHFYLMRLVIINLQTAKRMGAMLLLLLVAIVCRVDGVMNIIL